VCVCVCVSCVVGVCSVWIETTTLTQQDKKKKRGSVCRRPLRCNRLVAHEGIQKKREEKESAAPTAAADDADAFVMLHTTRPMWIPLRPAGKQGG
jgi:hypothetical protein